MTDEKPHSKSQARRLAVQRSKLKSWHACHDCNLNLGGVVPEGERCVTMCGGTCPYCGAAGTLIPHADYDWPGEGRKAEWD